MRVALWDLSNGKVTYADGYDLSTNDLVVKGMTIRDDQGTAYEVRDVTRGWSDTLGTAILILHIAPAGYGGPETRPQTFADYLRIEASPQADRLREKIAGFQRILRKRR